MNLDQIDVKWYLIIILNLDFFLGKLSESLAIDWKDIQLLLNNV